jgi:hypothetical protein
MAEFSWAGGHESEATCFRCGMTFDSSDLDRLLWCEACRTRARARASRLGWIAGVLLGAALALWIGVVIRPSNLVIQAWIATVVAAVWIGAKAAREIAYGVVRHQNRPGAGA